VTPQGCTDSLFRGCHGGRVFLYSGLVSRPASLQIRNCAFLDNRAGFGGGIWVDYAYGTGRIIITGCRFERNWSSDAGGGFYAIVGEHGKPYIRIDSCHFENNTSWASGAFLLENYNKNIDFVLSHSYFKNNRVTTIGGAGAIANYIVKAKDKVIIQECHFDSNQAYSRVYTTAGRGGALSTIGAIIRNCTFIKNKAVNGGAILVADSDVYNNIIAGNYAVENGGAITGEYEVNLISNTIINNHAGKSGGMGKNVNKPRFKLINNIIWGNRAGESGDFFANTVGLFLYLEHCVLDANDCESVESDLGHISNTLVCGLNLYFNLEPHFRDTANGDYRLASCSPLLDLDDPTWVQQQGITTDFAGNPRILDDAPDIGAYEIKKEVPPPEITV